MLGRLRNMRVEPKRNLFLRNTADTLGFIQCSKANAVKFAWGVIKISGPFVCEWLCLSWGWPFHTNRGSLSHKTNNNNDNENHYKNLVNTNNKRGVNLVICKILYTGFRFQSLFWKHDQASYLLFFTKPSELIREKWKTCTLFFTFYYCIYLKNNSFAN